MVGCPPSGWGCGRPDYGSRPVRVPCSDRTSRWLREACSKGSRRAGDLTRHSAEPSPVEDHAEGWFVAAAGMAECDGEFLLKGCGHDAAG